MVVLVQVITLNVCAAKPSASTTELLTPKQVFHSPMNGASEGAFYIRPGKGAGEYLVLRKGKDYGLQVVRGSTTVRTVALPKNIDWVHALSRITKDRCFVAYSDRSTDEHRVVEVSLKDGKTTVIHKSDIGVWDIDHSGKRLFVACSGNRAVVFDVTTRKRIQTFIRGLKPDSAVERAVMKHASTGARATDRMMLSLALNAIRGSHDGTRCVTSHEVGHLEGWDVKTGKRLWRRGGEKDLLQILNRHPTKDTVLVDRDDGSSFSIASIDMTTGKELWSTNCSEPVLKARWAPDGTAIAVATDTRLLLISKKGKVTNAREFKEDTFLGSEWEEDDQEETKVLEWSPDGKRVHLAVDGMVSSFDRELRPQWPRYGTDPRLRRAEFMQHAGGSTVILGSRSLVTEINVTAKGLATTWSCTTRKAVKAIPSPDGKYVAIVELLDREDDEFKVTIVDRGNGRACNSWSFLDDGYQDVGFGVDGKYLYVGAYNRSKTEALFDNTAITRIELKSGKIVGHYNHPGVKTKRRNDEGDNQDWDDEEGDGCVYSLAMGPKGQLMAAVSDEDELMVWGLRRKGMAKIFQALPVAVEKLHLRTDGIRWQVAAYGSYDSFNDDEYALMVYNFSVGNEKPLTPKAIAAAVKDLGADRFNVRRRATRRLIGGGLSTIPHLPMTSVTPDPEVKERLKQVCVGVLEDMRLDDGRKYDLSGGTGVILPVEGHLDHWIMGRYDDRLGRKVLDLVRLEKGDMTVLKRIDNSMPLGRLVHERACIGKDHQLYLFNIDCSISVFDLRPHLPKKPSANSTPRSTGLKL
jgi:WD40 repeat protein